VHKIRGPIITCKNLPFSSASSAVMINPTLGNAVSGVHP
jgi:hypothetical protein